MYKDENSFATGESLGGSTSQGSGSASLLDVGAQRGHTEKVEDRTRPTSRGEVGTSEA